MTLSLSETAAVGTGLEWSLVSGAFSYDVVRGDVKEIKELDDRYHLGSLTCIVSGSEQASTAGQEDAAHPALGEAFF